MADPRPTESKRFLGFVVSMGLWALVSVLLMCFGITAGHIDADVFTLLLVDFIIVGAVQVGFLLGLNGLDKYLKLVQIAVDKNIDMDIGDVKVKQKVFPAPVTTVKAEEEKAP